MHKSTVWPFTMRHVRFRPPLPIYMLFHSKRTIFLMQCRLRTIFRHRTHFLQYKASVIVCITFICKSCTVLCTESALFCVDTVYFGRYNTIVKAPKLFIVTPHAEAGGNLTRRLLFRFVRFAAGKLSKKRTVLLRAVLKKQPALSMLKSDRFKKLRIIRTRKFYGLSLSGLRNRNIASLMLSPSSSMVKRSTPRPKPPCGGQPYLKNSR